MGVGANVGTRVGENVGTREGESDGTREGESDGTREGGNDGTREGDKVPIKGDALGFRVGLTEIIDGEREGDEVVGRFEGKRLGADDGAVVGFAEGASLQMIGPV